MADEASAEAPPPEPTPEPPGDTVEIHKPHVWHGWREFLKEYVIIFVGVLTALGAEQLAEWVHSRHEAAETRQALKVEVAWDLATAERWARLGRCEEGRLEELDRWWAGLRAGRQPTLGRSIDAPRGLLFRQQVWQAGGMGGVAKLPFEERNLYAEYYSLVSTLERMLIEKRDRWDDLHGLGYVDGLDAGQLARIRSDIDVLRRSNDAWNTNMAPMRADAARLGVSSAAAEGAQDRTMPGFAPAIGDQDRKFCQPLGLTETGAAEGPAHG